jgi:hypothetical protein
VKLSEPHGHHKDMVLEQVTKITNCIAEHEFDPFMKFE